jgi:hypothetical protein
VIYLPLFTLWPLAGLADLTAMNNQRPSGYG